MTEWNVTQGLGIVWMTLLLDDPNEGPPTGAGVTTWKTNFGLNSSFIGADPGFSMVVGSSVGTPMFTVIDPRTMTVAFKMEGGTGDHCMDINACSDPAKQKLFEIALQNKAAP